MSNITPYPGPWWFYWRTNDEGHADCGVFWEKSEGYAYSVCRAPRYEKREQWEANAKLIVAAPVMAKSLQELIDIFDNWADKKDEIDKAIDQARKVIESSGF